MTISILLFQVRYSSIHIKAGESTPNIISRCLGHQCHERPSSLVRAANCSSSCVPMLEPVSTSDPFVESIVDPFKGGGTETY
jgi:hypothetical protein